jgi:hypothetical protein
MKLTEMKLSDLSTAFEDQILGWMVEDARRHDGANFRVLQDEIMAAAGRGEVSDEHLAKWIRAHQHAIESLVRQAHALTRYRRHLTWRAE